MWEDNASTLRFLSQGMLLAFLATNDEEKSPKNGRCKSPEKIISANCSAIRSID